MTCGARPLVAMVPGASAGLPTWPDGECSHANPGMVDRGWRPGQGHTTARTHLPTLQFLRIMATTFHAHARCTHTEMEREGESEHVRADHLAAVPCFALAS